MSVSFRKILSASLCFITVYSNSSVKIAAEEECKNILYANEDNTLVLFFHNDSDRPNFTMVRDGDGQICEGIISFGAGGVSFYCSPEVNGIMRSAWGIDGVDPDKTFHFMDELVTEQCAR
ncbi:MAG: hypothetical protein K5905_06825 [Roseibium sp.]|uniref:hypothetical protein n=1 Tax=Roseibium sp. TaxID=1936156 RepID=UPI00262230F6|nr:hypothetical protein [Roseibium sp.]MCV0425167.1 hypothetical protein [Roseibium sp.]